MRLKSFLPAKVEAEEGKIAAGLTTKKEWLHFLSQHLKLE
jgi:hypothetical protein